MVQQEPNEEDQERFLELVESLREAEKGLGLAKEDIIRKKGIISKQKRDLKGNQGRIEKMVQESERMKTDNDKLRKYVKETNRKEQFVKEFRDKFASIKKSETVLRQEKK